MGRNAEAADALRLAVKNGVDDVELQLLLAALLHEAGRTDEAVTAFELVRQQGGEVPLANRHLGLLYFGQERFTESAERFESVLDFDPEDHVALYNLGVLYMDYLGDGPRAAEAFERYVAAGGPNARVPGWLRQLRQ
jgi:tetratricopeptide (TPR) repeat protein